MHEKKARGRFAVELTAMVVGRGAFTGFISTALGYVQCSSLKEIEAAESAIHKPRPFLGRGEIMQPSACRFVPRPSRDGAAKRWVANEIGPFLAARRAGAYAATRQERP